MGVRHCRFRKVAVCVVFLFLTCCLRVIKDNMVVLDSQLDFAMSKDMFKRMSTIAILSSTASLIATTTTPNPQHDVIENKSQSVGFEFVERIQSRISGLPDVVNDTKKSNVCEDSDKHLGKLMLLYLILFIFRTVELWLCADRGDWCHEHGTRTVSSVSPKPWHRVWPCKWAQNLSYTSCEPPNGN